MEKIFHPKCNQNRVGVAIIISEKTKSKLSKKKDKESIYIIVKGLVHQVTTIINIKHSTSEDSDI